MNICICGINGKMSGHVHKELAKDFNIVGIDKVRSNNVYTNYVECFEENTIDVLVDFSSREIAYEVIKYALENKIKVISGTTNFSKKEINSLKKLAIKNDVTFILSSNFAKGIKLFYENLSKMKKSFNNRYLIETHHAKKLDKPSGTAKVIAKKVKILEENITALRIPEHNATHEVIFLSEYEKITIRHEVLNYKAFVNGFLEEFKCLLQDKTVIKIY